MGDDVKIALAFAIDHIDLRLRLVRSAQMRHQRCFPTVERVAEIPCTTFLAVLRQFRFIGKLLVFVLAAADHQAHDLIGALLIEAVFVVERNRVSRFPVAAIGHEPALCRGFEHAVGKRVIQFDQPRDGEPVGRVFSPAEDRNFHLTRGGMRQFVKHHEQRVSDYEFRDLLKIFRRKFFESRILASACAAASTFA